MRAKSFAEKLVAIGRDRRLEDVGGVGEEHRFSKHRVQEKQLEAETERLREENERLWEELTQARVNVVTAAAEEEEKEKVDVDQLEADREELEQANARLRDELCKSKRVLGQLVVQKRVIEKNLREEQAKRAAAEDERDDYARHASLFKLQHRSIRNYLVQLGRFRRNDRETPRLAQARRDIATTVEDKQLQRLLAALEEEEQPQAASPAPVFSASSSPASPPSSSDAPEGSPTELVQRHFQLLRAHLRNGTRPSAQDIHETERTLRQAVAEHEETLDGLGRENLRLERELRSLQLQ